MFQRVDLANNIIAINNLAFAKAIYSAEDFAISLSGKIINFKNKNKIFYNFDDIIIFNGKASLINKLEPLGNSFKIKSNFSQVSISIQHSFNKIFDLNRHLALYEDTSSEGIDNFRDKILEEIGWNAIEFGITYRKLVEFLEENGNGVLIFFENSDPNLYSFNGLAFANLDNLELNRKILKDFVKNEIKNQIDNNLGGWKKYGFSDEQISALKYFEVDLQNLI
jgi:hypothetical protein